MADTHADTAPEDDASTRGSARQSETTSHHLQPAAAQDDLDMADAPSDPAQDDLDAAREEIKNLRQALVACDDRIQILEGHNRQLLARGQLPDNTIEWLLDFAMQRDHEGLLKALANAEVPLPSMSATLGGGGTLLKSTVHAATLTAQVNRKCCFRFLDLPAELRNRIYELAAKAAFSVPCMVAYRQYDPDVPASYHASIREKCVDHSL